MSFETIKEFYQLGLWSESQLKELLAAGVITESQYDSIVGITESIPDTSTTTNDKEVKENTTVARG